MHLVTVEEFKRLQNMEIMVYIEDAEDLQENKENDYDLMKELVIIDKQLDDILDLYPMDKELDDMRRWAQDWIDYVAGKKTKQAKLTHSDVDMVNELNIISKQIDSILKM